MMASPRKHHSAEIKAKVALEAIKGVKTTNEIASEYGVHLTQISQWKKQVLDELPEIFTTDQGVQFTSAECTQRLEAEQIRISHDGRGRTLDNIFVERLWRSAKYEEMYLKEYDTVPTARRNLQQYFAFYNNERLYQALDYRTPAAVHYAQ